MLDFAKVDSFATARTRHDADLYLSTSCGLMGGEMVRSGWATQPLSMSADCYAANIISRGGRSFWAVSSAREALRGSTPVCGVSAIGAWMEKPAEEVRLFFFGER